MAGMGLCGSCARAAFIAGISRPYRERRNGSRRVAWMAKAVGLFPRLGAYEEFGRLGEGRWCGATEHLGEFMGAALEVKRGRLRGRSSLGDMLGEEVVAIAIGGDLWQVGDAEDLMAGAKSGEFLA